MTTVLALILVWLVTLAVGGMMATEKRPNRGRLNRKNPKRKWAKGNRTWAHIGRGRRKGK